MKPYSSSRSNSPSEPWIRDPKRFRLAMILTGILALLSIHYPGTRPLYEEFLRSNYIPLAIPLFGNGQLFYATLLFLGFALWTLFLIWDSLNRHRLLFCLALLLGLPLLSQTVLLGYQSFIAPGVYAVDVDQERTGCTYNLEGDRMTGSCTLWIDNRSGRDLTLQPTLQVPYGQSSEGKMASIPLDPIQIGVREELQVYPDFDVVLPQKTDSGSITGGYVGFFRGGLLLTLNDGQRERTWERP